jgi:hypothetical protein
MDLLSSIRKEGSRGGVNFQWSDVTASQHREHYLGHSIMAPVGRWQKGRDLSWYAKVDPSSPLSKSEQRESAEEKRAKERREEIRLVKEAEGDALAKALGLPVAERSEPGTGANAVEVEEVKRVIKETEIGDEIEEASRTRGFGDFVGRVEEVDVDASGNGVPERGGLVRRDGRQKSERNEREGRSRSRSRSRERRHRRHHYRERSKGRDRDRYEGRERNYGHHRDRDRERERPGASDDRRRDDSRTRHPPWKDSHRRYRSRSTDRRPHREDRERRRSREPRRRRSHSPRYDARERSRERPGRSRSPHLDRRDRRRDREDDRRRW